MKIIKRIYLMLVAVLAVIAVINLTPIKVKAEILVSTGEHVPFYKLRVGDVFYDAEDTEPLVYRVVKKPTSKSNKFDIEIAGINENYKCPGNFNPNKVYIGVDSETMEELLPFRIVGIGDYAFKDNKTIYSFNVYPCYDFKYVGKGAFEGCTYLHRFDTRNTPTIKARAFWGCSSLNEFHLTGNKLKRVGKDAFKNTKTKMKLIAENMNDKQVLKVKKLFKKAGVKKLRIKREFY